MENTLGAFKHAVSCGLNMVECDVQLTKDDQVVICHDRDLGRVCGIAYEGRYVTDFNYRDLPVMQNKISMHLTEGDYNKRDDEDGKFCLLHDLFE